MESKKELKQQLDELINNNKIVVEVLQNKKLVNVWTDEKNNIINLLGFLYSKTILKNKGYKIRYKYNYTDKQVINIIYSYYNYDNTKTTFNYIFYNIPTNLAYLDTLAINKKMEV